jgi:hypothetical protein
METFCRGDVLCGDVLYVRRIRLSQNQNKGRGTGLSVLHLYITYMTVFVRKLLFKVLTIFIEVAFVILFTV